MQTNSQLVWIDFQHLLKYSFYMTHTKSCKRGLNPNQTINHASYWTNKRLICVISVGLYHNQITKIMCATNKCKFFFQCYKNINLQTSQFLYFTDSGGSRTSWEKSWYQNSEVWSQKVDFHSDRSVSIKYTR